MRSTLSTQPTLESFARFLAVEPQLDGCAPLLSLVRLADRTLLHAGPPFDKGSTVPVPVLNSASAAAVFEGWALDETTARNFIRSGDIRLAPAQDYGVVTPLAFVVSPSMWVLRVGDAAGRVQIRYAPVNDGPAGGALRFGANSDARSERLALLSRVGPALRAATRSPVPVLPIMQAGIAGGDDLHGRVSAANAALSARLAPRLTGEANDYLSVANQFVLNVLMAACSVMIGAGAGIRDSRAVTVAGGNGVTFGWQLAGEPSVWHSAAASPPIGPHFAGAAGRRFLPAIGDSAVIDACGFGAAALRYAPELAVTLRGHVAEAYFDVAASAPFIAPRPGFPPDLNLCLDIDRVAPVRGVMLAAIDADGEAGLVGRGVAPW